MSNLINFRHLLLILTITDSEATNMEAHKTLILCHKWSLGRFQPATIRYDHLWLHYGIYGSLTTTLQPESWCSHTYEDLGIIINLTLEESLLQMQPKFLSSEWPKNIPKGLLPAITYIVFGKCEGAHTNGPKYNKVARLAPRNILIDAKLMFQVIGFFSSGGPKDTMLSIFLVSRKR